MRRLLVGLVVLNLLLLVSVSVFAADPPAPERVYSPLIRMYYCGTSTACSGMKTLQEGVSSPSSVCGVWNPVASNGNTVLNKRFEEGSQPTSHKCVADIQQNLTGTVTQRYFTLTIPSGSWCPEGYGRDTAQPASSGQACYKDVYPEPPDDCTSKAGQEYQAEAMCRRAHCKSGFFNDSEGKVGCRPASSLTSTSIKIPSPITVSGCEAVLVRAIPTVVSPTNNGDISTTVYCDLTYQFTGNQGGSGDSAPNDPPPNGSGPLQPGTGSQLPSDSGGGGDGGGSGGGTGGGSGGGSGGEGGGVGGGTTGTDGGSKDPCVPTPEHPCTQTGDGSYDCVPTVYDPCTGSNAQTAECERSPVCTGDAVQCAQMVQTWKSVCEVHKALTDMPEDVQAQIDQLNGFDPSVDETYTGQLGLLQSHIANFQAAFGSAPSGSCPPDITISVLSRSVTFPISELCGFLSFLKLLLHLGVDLLAVRLLYRSVSSGE